MLLDTTSGSTIQSTTNENYIFLQVGRLLDLFSIAVCSCFGEVAEAVESREAHTGFSFLALLSSQDLAYFDFNTTTVLGGGGTW